MLLRCLRYSLNVHLISIIKTNFFIFVQVYFSFHVKLVYTNWEKFWNSTWQERQYSNLRTDVCHRIGGRFIEPVSTTCDGRGRPRKRRRGNPPGPPASVRRGRPETFVRLDGGGSDYETTSQKQLVGECRAIRSQKICLESCTLYAQKYILYIAYKISISNKCSLKMTA